MAKKFTIIGKVCQWRTEAGFDRELHQIYRESLKGKELSFELLNDDDMYLRMGAIRVLASRSLSAFRQAYLINPAIVNQISSDWHLADLLKENDFYD